MIHAAASSGVLHTGSIRVLIDRDDSTAGTVC
jgi:hypothetical protein